MSRSTSRGRKSAKPARNPGERLRTLRSRTPKPVAPGKRIGSQPAEGGRAVAEFPGPWNRPVCRLQCSFAGKLLYTDRVPDHAFIEAAGISFGIVIGAFQEDNLGCFHSLTTSFSMCCVPALGKFAYAWSPPLNAAARQAAAHLKAGHAVLICPDTSFDASRSALVAAALVKKLEGTPPREILEGLGVWPKFAMAEANEQDCRAVANMYALVIRKFGKQF